MLTTVASFTEPWEAHLFRGRLAAEGIRAVISDEHHVWNMWPYALALGGVKVQVFGADREAALAVLAGCLAGNYRTQLAAELGPLDDLRCPKCGAENIASRRAIPWIALLAASYLVISEMTIFPLRPVIHRCRSCKANWAESLSVGKGLSLALTIGLVLVAFNV